MDYMPLTKSMHRVGGVPLGDTHTALLFDKIKSAGATRYKFMLAVLDDATGEPVYFVASEVNELAPTLGGGSHFLGVFDGSGHANLGASDAWADPMKFYTEALRLAGEQFGVAGGVGSVEPLGELVAGVMATPSKPWWRFWERP